MIKALETAPDGLCMVLALTWANLDKLAADQPIRLRSEELGVRPGFDVWILGGTDVASITEDLRAVGMRLPDADAYDDGLLRFCTRWRGGAGPELPVLLLGITARADRRLRAGGGYRWPVTDRRGLAVRLLAGPDTDTLGRLVTAGRIPELAVDRRGGRID